MSFVDIDRVSKAFAGVRAVVDCTVHIDRGALLGLIGPNGAGKSTLFNIVSGLIVPDTGRVAIDGTELTGQTPDQVARAGIGRTFQTPRAFATLTVLENLLVSVESRGDRLGPALTGAYRAEQDQLRARAVELLERVDLAHRAGVRCDLLSGGELRMVEVARQLMRRPQVLLLDEPTAGVNPRLQTRLATLLRSLHADGTTMVVVEHNLRFLLDLADEVVVMVQGSILTRGRPQEVRRDPKVISAYLGSAGGDHAA